MGEDISFRFYREGDEEEIVAHLSRVFPKWGSFSNPVELYRWKYLDTPLRTIITLALDGDKIVGCIHSLIYQAKIGDEMTSLHYGDDLAVASECRGMGLWRKLNNSKNQAYPLNAKYAYSTTTNPKVLQSWKKRNRELLPFTVTRMMKTRNLDLQLQERPMKNKTLTKIGYRTLEAVNQITTAFTHRPVKQTEFSISSISEFDERINRFWEQVKDDYRLIIQMHPDYLNWRHKDNDRGIHQKFIATEGDRILGFTVVEYKQDSSEGKIVDLIAVKERMDVASALLETAYNCLIELGVNTVFYQVVSKHPYQRLSQLHGFIDSRSTPTVEFDYTNTWKEHNDDHYLYYLDNTVPDQIYFNYASTI